MGQYKETRFSIENSTEVTLQHSYHIRGRLLGCQTHNGWLKEPIISDPRSSSLRLQTL